MSKSVLVTGANGFVGRHLLEVGKSLGYKVHAGLRSTSSTGTIDHLDVPIHRLSYLDAAALQEELRVIGPFDIVIHNGGVTQAIDLDTYREGNVKVTEHLAQACQSQEVLTGPFIYVSSLAARGPNYQGQDAPISDYGISKLEAEDVAKGLLSNWVMIRPTAVYGSGDHGFLELVKIVKSHLFLTLGSRKQRLTMIHGHDLAQLIFDSHGEIGKTIYGWDKGIYSQRDLNESIKTSLGTSWTIPLQIGIPILKSIAYIMNGIYKSLFGKAWHYNPKKMKELVALDWSIHEAVDPWPEGFSPRFSLQEGFDEAVAYYREKKWI